MTNDEQEKNELLDALKITLPVRNLPNFDDKYLELEIKSAIATINRCRRFTPTETVLYDPKYEYLIIPMCIASLAKIGAEGQNTHNENGIQRTYGSSGNYPKELLTQIIPLVK